LAAAAPAAAYCCLLAAADTHAERVATSISDAWGISAEAAAAAEKGCRRRTEKRFYFVFFGLSSVSLWFRCSFLDDP